MELFRKLRWLLQRHTKETELQQEIEFHLSEEAEERQAAGLSMEDARRAARKDLGNAALIFEETRAAWTWTVFEQLLQDIGYSLRTMRVNKMFTALVLLSLALGIGANTAVFSFMESILLRALPVPDPESLVTLSWYTPKAEMHGMNLHNDSYLDDSGGVNGGVFAYPAFELFKKNEVLFSSVFAYQSARDLTVVMPGMADSALGEYVSGDYFGGLGVTTIAGRTIIPDDDRPASAPVAVLSFASSQKWFGEPSRAIGQSILINNVGFLVIGVAPREFFGADPNTTPSLYLPMHTNVLVQVSIGTIRINDWYGDPNFEWVDVMARLRPGVSRDQAQSVLAPQFSEWVRTTNTVRQKSNLPALVVKPGAGGLEGLKYQYSKPLYVLLALVALILAIACANIANLLLARTAARNREMAVRLSLGAGRTRIVRQLLTESVLLALLGGALGVLFARWGITLLTMLLASGRENFTLRAELNWYVLGVAAALSITTGLLFGLAPALHSMRVDLMPTLKQLRSGGRRRSCLLRQFNMPRLLIVAQIILTLLILMTAGLFTKTLSNLKAIQVGFNEQSVLTFAVNARQAGHGDSEIVGIYNELRTRFSAIPGVLNVSQSELPLIGIGSASMPVSISGGPRKGSRILTVGSDFFTTMQIPILLGREIDERDRPGSTLVAVVNEAFIKANGGGQNPMGQYLMLPSCAKCQVQIVGVAKNALYGNPRGPAPPTVYLPYSQGVWGPPGQLFYELRTSGNPLAYIDAVREIVHRTDERVPLFDVQTQSARIEQTMRQEITLARLCSAFAVLALAIACVGLYGTTSYSVARRTSEIGIRMALGAQRRRIAWTILREVLLLLGIGLALTVPASFATSKLIQSFLFGMNGNDSASLIVAVLILTAAATLAGYLPARKASRIDPLVALRHE